MVWLVYSGSSQIIGGIKPASQIDTELVGYTLDVLNTERWRNDASELDYDRNSIAQEWAHRMLQNNEVVHNPELPERWVKCGFCHQAKSGYQDGDPVDDTQDDEGGCDK